MGFSKLKTNPDSSATDQTAVVLEVPVAFADYEVVLARLFDQLSHSPERNVRVFLRRAFKGLSGQSYVIDLGYEFELLGVTYLTVIEAKFYRNSVVVGEVLEFVAKLNDIKAHKGIVITTRGFQKGAQRIAESNRIALLVYRPDDHDGPEAILRREEAEKDNPTGGGDSDTILAHRLWEQIAAFQNEVEDSND